MFIPIYDGVELRYLSRPIMTYGLIGLNIMVYVLGIAATGNKTDALEIAFGVIPSVLLGSASLSPELAWIPPQLSLLTSMFLHANFWHLAGNMLFLWVFGDNVEDAMGSWRFLLFYLLCGFAASLCYSFMQPMSESPLIGASGAISGVVAAYLMLYPRVYVFGLVFAWLPLSIPAVYCVGAWIVLQIGAALVGGDPEIGWWAHVGGLACGAVLTPVLKRGSVSLFSAQRH